MLLCLGSQPPFPTQCYRAQPEWAGGGLGAREGEGAGEARSCGTTHRRMKPKTYVTLYSPFCPLSCPLQKGRGPAA